MIIECINCNKKFDVNSELIPSSGRTIQCGSCNHIWFYDPSKNILKNIEKPKKRKEIFEQKPIPKKKRANIKVEKKDNISVSKNKKNYEVTEYKAKSNFSLNKFLSYILVLIITFIALLIVVDTFNSTLYLVFPNLELIVFSLFETLKDIRLFIKDLI
tara:strand:- start:491 stop:964 length:474 start_codon:yes stop_codon:yes gene_type:complete